MHNSQCIYDLAADQRRKIANRRNVQELQRHRFLLGGIIALIRARAPETPDRLLRVIRTNFDLSEVGVYIENALNAKPSIYQSYQRISFDLDGSPRSSMTSPSSSSQSSRDERLNQYSLINSPMTLHALPWTFIADDETIRHLLALYFSWEQPFLQFIDKSTFLADMASGEISHKTKFCSPLLVNALLAQACVSDHVGSRLLHHLSG